MVLTSLNIRTDGTAPAAPVGDKDLRKLLLAKKRQLGNYERLKEECAYEQWHRMLFARFLAENGLLMHPEGVAVTLADCADLVEPGDADGWAVAARYASAMLPGIFRESDPLLAVRLAPEGRLAFERLLEALPAAVFTASDSLGWVYQFWQTQRKAEVNASGRKIGGEDLPAVTQLFTEPYMVKFLLQNSLGAWWAARHPDSSLVAGWEYLLRNEDGTPAAGSFPGWPDRAADLRAIDPCCGSGHFLVELFGMLRRMRSEEAGLSETEAGDAVLRDNLHGLELDERCVQIAAFALALAAWKEGGFRPLPVPKVACSGLRLTGTADDWAALARGDGTLDTALRRLYHLFRDAPELGSLIRPRDEADGSGLFAVEWADVAAAVERATRSEAADPVAALFGEAASGVARAAGLLSGRYHLVATNVPYLARGKHDETLRSYLETHHNAAKADLATAFVERCRDFCAEGGTYALVTPQNWLFLGSYKRHREKLLSKETWKVVIRLGPRAFETIGGEVVSVALIALTHALPTEGSTFIGLDAADAKTPREKDARLRESAMTLGSPPRVKQAGQLENSDARIVFGNPTGSRLLAEYADSYWGLGTGDTPRYTRCFWELQDVTDDWILIQSTVEETISYGGRQHILFWEDGVGELANSPGSYVRGTQIWSSKGILVSQMRQLPACLYTGEAFDQNGSPIIPHDPAYLPAIWAFCSSPEYAEAVRRIDQKLNVTNATLVKVPFDLERWQKVADEMGPLPEPHSDDPTQWLFKGNVPGSTAPLHVAAARILGYRWPEQPPDGLDALADDDGIVCLPAVSGERPGAERLRAFLASAYGPEWDPALLERFLADEGYAGRDLEAWLREGFFASHCRLFHNRPFVWQIWDGRRDGFSALVNYHGLDRAKLEKLAYTYLGDWIARQKADQQSGLAGADGRVVAALELQKKLQAILHGEPPHDVYIRWKPLHEQPIGWEPDLNDGVRLNIRPFVTAGILRSRFTVNWNKDRGTNPDGSERINDLHFTRAEKEEARRAHREQQAEPPAAPA